MGPRPVPAGGRNEDPGEPQGASPPAAADRADRPPARPWLFTAGPSQKHPTGDHLNVKRLNEQFTRLVGRLGLPVGRDSGFVVHSLRHFFETFTGNAGVSQRAIDTWLGHRSDRSMAVVYYRLRDEDSQRFMAWVPFGTGGPVADAGIQEAG